jgi:glycosyltransferase involved in cell wall biosynthesis
VVDHNNKPRVTFYVIAYNQARFVRQAVEGALAQTYSSTEILLSDDCSTDDTFAIIQDAVKDYSGPHTIVLNRNDRNLGVSEHLNRIMELASGELIVASDGDDVSHPCRTERCVEAWLKHGKPAALSSSLSCIDATGQPSQTRNGAEWFAQFFPAENEARTDCLIRFSKQGSPRLVTCSGAWTKEMHDAFGPLAPGIWYEDDLITLRAWLFDRIAFIPDPLVSYREHDSNISNRAPKALVTRSDRQHAEHATRTQARRKRETLLGHMRDLDVAVRRGWITQPMCEQLKREFTKQCAFHWILEEWWNLGWIPRLWLFVFLVACGRAPERRWCSTRLLPLPIFLRVAALWSRCRVWKTLLTGHVPLFTAALRHRRLRAQPIHPRGSAPMDRLLAPGDVRRSRRALRRSHSAMTPAIEMDGRAGTKTP